MGKHVALLIIPASLTEQALRDAGVPENVDIWPGLRLANTVEYRGTVPALIGTQLTMLKLPQEYSPAQVQTWLNNHGFIGWKLIGVWDEEKQPSGETDGEGRPIRKLRSWAVNHGYSKAQIVNNLRLYFPEGEEGDLPLSKWQHWAGKDTYGAPETDAGFLDDYNQE